MKWDLIYNSANHRLFRNESGDISIGDQSGDQPDQCDDGPLIVNPDAQVLVHYYVSAIYKTINLCFVVSVLCQRDNSDASCSLNRKDFAALYAVMGGNLRISESPEYQSLVKEIDWVSAIPENV